MPVVVGSSRTVRYYSTGTKHVYGYISTSNNFDVDTSVPTDLVVSDTPATGNFDITHTLEPGTYYFWCRLWHELASGEFSITITNTSGGGGEGGGGSGGGGQGGGEPLPEIIGNWRLTTTDLSNSPLYTNYTQSVSLGSEDVRCIKCRFDVSGQAVFYTTGDIDTCGFVGTTPDFSNGNGEPASYIYYDENSGDGRNFRISINVDTNTTYYFWYKCVSWSGSCVAHIDTPAMNWTAKSEMFIEIRDYSQINYISLGVCEIQKITFTATEDGRVSFFSYNGLEGDGEPDLETVGFVTMEGNTTFDRSTGIPYNAESLEDMSVSGDGNHFLYNIYVIHGYTYHFWVRPKSANASGTTTVEISPLRHEEWSISRYSTVVPVLSEDEIFRYQHELVPFEIGYRRFVFETSGVAKFQIVSTTYHNGCVGYVVSQNNDYLYDFEYCDLYDGFPLHSLYTAENQSLDGSGLEISANVTAGTEYYFWYKCFRYGESGGVFDIQIIAPGDGIPDQGDENTPWTLQPRVAPDALTTLFYGAVDMEQFDLYRLNVRFAYSGTAQFYTTGDLATCGYVGTDNMYNLYEGSPVSYIYYDNLFGQPRNLNISFPVRAGQTYYLWFRCVRGTDAGRLELYVVPPDGSGGGGSDAGSVVCKIYYNGSWHNATPYVYDGSAWRVAVPKIFV